MGSPIRGALDGSIENCALIIEDGTFFDHAWLATLLPSLPHLRHLFIHSHGHLSFVPGLASFAPFRHQLEVLRLCAYPGTKASNAHVRGRPD